MQFLSLSSDMIVVTSLKIMINLRNFSILKREPPIPILSPPPPQKKPHYLVQLKRFFLKIKIFLSE